MFHYPSKQLHYSQEGNYLQFETHCPEKEPWDSIQSMLKGLLGTSSAAAWSLHFWRISGSRAGRVTPCQRAALAKIRSASSTLPFTASQRGDSSLKLQRNHLYFVLGSRIACCFRLMHYKAMVYMQELFPQTYGRWARSRAAGAMHTSWRVRQSRTRYAHPLKAIPPRANGDVVSIPTIVRCLVGHASTTIWIREWI